VVSMMGRKFLIPKPGMSMIRPPRPFYLDQRARYYESWEKNITPDIKLDYNDTIRPDEEITLSDLLESIFGNSPFLSKAAIKNPQCLSRLIELGPNKGWEIFFESFQRESSAIADINSLKKYLRTQKEIASLHIAICDICGFWDLFEVMRNLSDFADMCVTVSLNALLRIESDRGNIELKDKYNPQLDSGIFIIALGKLGAQELNYSSDIDLMVLYDIETLPYRGEKSPQEFAIKLTKELIRILDERTPDGYVFRTDLRLRPDPGSTSVAVSTEAAELYYESWGQNWERSALIKARIIAGDQKTGNTFLKNLEPFIWRKSLDFYAIQDIHSIKRQIYAAKGGAKIDLLGHDIKIGRGGIREIEFFVQIQQLIWGGRNTRLRNARTLEGLTSLQEYGLVESDTAQQLAASYVFLRNLEHRLQMINDEQTQKIPIEKSRAEALSMFMGFENFKSFTEVVTHHLRQVERHYANLFEDAPDLTIDGNLVFTGADHDPDTLHTLSKLNFENPEAVSQIIRAWHHGRYRATKSPRARQILTEIIPNLVSSFGKTTQPDRAFLKFDYFLEQLPAGVQLFSVFYTHPEILELVADIMGDAPRLADYLTASSERLDYVLDPEFFNDLPKLDELSRDLDQALMRVQEFERKLDICRSWTNDLRFRVGVQVLRYQLSPFDGAYALSNIAEATIKSLIPHVCKEFEKQYGILEDGNISILAYGKLSSKELMPTSDLDLVIIYDSPIDSKSTKGERSLPASAYYIRLAQRIVSSLTVLTAEGRLYDLDLRLRPSGEQGPLACSFEAFQKYQQEDAWIWEHLALTKTRTIFTTGELGNRIAIAIQNILKRKRNKSEVAKAILDMQARIQEKYDGTGLWNIKHMPGGLLDTEFLVQFHVLLNYEIVRSTQQLSTIDIIENLTIHGILNSTDAKILRDGVSLWTNILWLYRLTHESSDTNTDIPHGLARRILTATNISSMDELKINIHQTGQKIRLMLENTLGGA
jgi:[glutamine synthetase] adenylyltransferase / [glutamine synthetase]-adenylyl-L-tyrosine phosphorylase